MSLLNILTIMFVARALLSWFPIDSLARIRPAVDILYRVTEPVLAPIRRMLPPMAGLDISNLIVVFGIQLILKPLVRGIF